MPLCFCEIHRKNIVKNSLPKSFFHTCLDFAWGIRIVDGNEKYFSVRLFSGFYKVIPLEGIGKRDILGM